MNSRPPAPPPPTTPLRDAAALREGIRRFNAGAYFDAHEAWEALWLVARGDDRVCLQGLIQVAAAFHKRFAQRDRASAVRLLTRGLAKLANLASDHAGLELETFRIALRNVLATWMTRDESDDAFSQAQVPALDQRV